MENSKQSAFPCDNLIDKIHNGLTKREYFAGLAMQGLCACPDLVVSREQLAIESVKQADELLKQLSQTN